MCAREGREAKGERALTTRRVEKSGFSGMGASWIGLVGSAHSTAGRDEQQPTNSGRICRWGLAHLYLRRNGSIAREDETAQMGLNRKVVCQRQALNEPQCPVQCCRCSAGMDMVQY